MIGQPLQGMMNANAEPDIYLCAFMIVFFSYVIWLFFKE